MEYLNRKESFLLKAHSFTNEESFREALARYDIEILLISESISIEDWDKRQIKNIIILSEGGLTKEGNEYPCLYKYQSGENFIKDMLSFCLNDEDTAAEAAYRVDIHNTRVWSVFSPCGGTGVTGLAYYLGQYLGKSHTVLLSNWEMFPGNYTDGKDNEKGGLEEIMYYLQQGRGGIALKLKLITERLGRLDYLKPIEHYKVLGEIGTGEAEQFINSLCRHGGYDELILDIGYFGEGIIRLLALSNYILVPKASGQTAEDKISRMFHYIEADNKVKKESFHVITVPWEIRQEMSDSLNKMRESSIIEDWIGRLLEHVI